MTQLQFMVEKRRLLAKLKGREAVIRRLSALITKLRMRVSEQTKQTQESAEFWHARVLETINRYGGVPDGVDPNGHPVEQIVGTVLANKDADIERLQSLVTELLDQRGRLRQMEADYQPGLPERRLADDLLDAIEEYETPASRSPSVASLSGTWPGEPDDGFEASIDELRHPERKAAEAAGEKDGNN